MERSLARPGALQAQRDDGKPPSGVDALIRLQSRLCAGVHQFGASHVVTWSQLANARVTALDRSFLTAKGFPTYRPVFGKS